MAIVQATATIKPTCDARTGMFASDYGFVPTWCNTSIGLREFRDRQGERRRYCAAPGHREAIAARYGEAYAEQDDDITAAKARDELELGVVHFDGGRFGDIEIEVVD